MDNKKAEKDDAKRGSDTILQGATKKSKIRKRKRPDTPTMEQRVLRLQKIMDEEPDLRNYVDENSELKNQVSVLKLKQSMVLKQLIQIKIDLTTSLEEVKRLIKLMDTQC